MLEINVTNAIASIRRGKARAALNNKSGAVEDFKKVLQPNGASIQLLCFSF
jgi:hypothetical protein